MTWTTDKPTKPGWYWWRNKKHYQVVEVVEVDEDRHFEVQGYSLNWRLKGLDGYWAGPLEPPRKEAS